jgi:hypothetical protein
MRFVNWEAHGKALAKVSAKQVHFSKLVHDCLPTHSQLNKYDGGSRKCPRCNEINEDRGIALFDVRIMLVLRGSEMSGL